MKNLPSVSSFAAWQGKVIVLFGVPDRVRTCDLWLRKPTLYPAELRVHVKPLATRPRLLRIFDTLVLEVEGGDLTYKYNVPSVRDGTEVTLSQLQCL